MRDNVNERREKDTSSEHMATDAVQLLRHVACDGGDPVEGY